jgi:NADH:ubiquinone oxidoreductase subunit 5 (subunit L)/multisubunit Na+/H+ antiporter MnhA subunit
MLRVIAVLALGTAVYGAALSLVQASARRACGYLFMSQSALVMAGLDCTSAGALAGGLLVWLSAGLAFAGLARCVLVLEARRGRLDLNTYHGGYERMPLLAISFLSMGLACTGFPGTLGFVGQELLVDGAVDAFPVMGFAVVIASALTGLAVVRMYFSLFCGRSDVHSQSGIRFGLARREAWTFAALVIVLVAFGLAPRPLVNSRFAASDDILRLRDAYRASIPGAASSTNDSPSFLMGLPGSRFSKIGVEITDSKYVVLNMQIMTRVGSIALVQMEHLDGEEGRLACRAYADPWLAEPEGKLHYVTAAFSSSCGKTNLAMVVPRSMPGWKAWTVMTSRGCAPGEMAVCGR